MNCRFCNTPLSNVLVDLKESPPSNSFLNKDQLKLAEAKFPLKIYVCHKCFLVQVDEFKKAEDIFSNEYVYFSSFSKSWLEHARQYTNKMIQAFGFNAQSLVIEIASNDGYLLQYFKEKHIPVLGIEPTGNTAKVAIEKGIDTRVDFFGVELAKQLVKEGKRADLLLGNNVLAHVPDINDFVGGMKLALKPGGVITMEFPHLVQLIKNNQFDTIYHEHFSYLSFTTVKTIFNKHGLDMFDVEEIPTHGGSLRIYAKHSEDQSKIESPNVTNLLNKEKELGVTNLEYYNGFQEKTDKVKSDFIKFLAECKEQGKKVCGYGAAAKGNTLLNYCGVSADLISFVVDASPHKQGKFLPGSKIPVVAEQSIKDFKPDYIIIFPWNIKDEVMNQLEYTKNWGATFVVAIPELKKF